MLETHQSKKNRLRRWLRRFSCGAAFWAVPYPMINSDCAVSKPAMKIVIQNANCTGTKNVRSKKEFRGWISVLVSCFESGTLGVRLLDFMCSTVKTFPGNPQRGQLLDFYKNGVCFVWRPAPRHTVPGTAPLPQSLGSVSCPALRIP